MKRFTKLISDSGESRKLFPFAFVVDQSMRVIEFGRSLGRLAPSIAKGIDVAELFQIERPYSELAWDFDSLRDHESDLFVLKVSCNGVKLRAEIIAGDDAIAFQVTPAVSSLSEFESLDLTFSDFSKADNVADLVFTLTMQQQTLNEVRRVAENLKSVNKRLSSANEELQSEIERRTTSEQERVQLHQRLLSASRDAGKAEIATGVLHNVGNVMNSVNVSVSLIRDVVRRRIADRLQAATDLLVKHQDNLAGFFENDERAAHLTTFLAAVRNEAEQALLEVETLRSQIDHVNVVVASQQSFASLGGLLSSFHVEEAIHEATQLTDAEYDRHNIRLEIELAELPAITSDKQRLVQVLVNLLRNAKTAVIDHQLSARIVTLRAVLLKADEIQISVIDSGVGIDRDNLSKIFQHGFSTNKRTGGHGFGLHHSSCAIEELGGQLRVESEGIGEGATFHIELPIDAPVKAAGMVKESTVEPGVAVTSGS